jgi:hypothetical protein
MELDRSSIHSCASAIEPCSSDERQDPSCPLYSSDISFIGDSFWGSRAYHRHLTRSSLRLAWLRPEIERLSPLTRPPSLPLPVPTTTSTVMVPVPPHPTRTVNNWLVGDAVYIPASRWFEPERLYAYPASVKMVLVARITKRTLKQVTLDIPALGKEFTRGFSFMEVSSLPTPSLPS